MVKVDKIGDVRDLWKMPGWDEAEAEYAAMAVPPLKGACNRDAYERLCDTGVASTFVARDEGTGEVLGFACVIYSGTTHSLQRLAAVDSIFVRKSSRAGAGLRLMEACRKDARERGCEAIMFSAQAGSGFDRLLGALRRMRKLQHVYLEAL